MKKFLFPTALCLAAATCFGQPLRPADSGRTAAPWPAAFDSLRRSHDIFREFDYSYGRVAEAARDTARIPAALAMLDTAIADGDRLLPAASDSIRHHCIQTLAFTSGVLNSSRRKTAAIQVALQGIRLNEKLHQHNAFPYFVLSIVYSSLGRTREGLAVAFDGLRTAQSPRGPADGMGYQAVVKTYYTIKEYQKCLDYFYEALPWFQKAPVLFLSPIDFIRNGTLAHMRLHQPEKALALLRQMQSLSDRTTHFMQQEPSGFTLLTADCYAALGKIDSAEYFYRKTLTQLPQPDFTFAKAGAYLDIANFDVDNRLYKKAEPLLDTLTAGNNRGMTSINNMERIWWLKYRVDSALHDYSGTTAALRNYLVFHDSLTNIAKNNQLTEMNVQFETEKKNQHIADLEKQTVLQSRLQQATVKQALIVRNSLIAGATLLALLAAGLYNRWQIRRRMSLRLEDLSARQQRLLTEKERLLGEKEWLLREIHHRVKNNLQIVISLLNMQAGELKDEIAVSAFHEIGARVNTISLVHKKLYQEGQDMTTIDMQEYVRELVGFLRESLAARHKIAFDLDIQQLVLDASQCIPLGLILNEAITNAIKYAFPGGSGGSPTICISLKEAPESCITLQIADNGVGLPAGFDAAGSKSLGLQLIHTLSLQLEGELVIANLPGRRLYPTTDPGAAGSQGLLIRLCFPWLEPMTKNGPGTDNEIRRISASL
ncbi:MAG TPA: histidine kinase dimerization/phosphoacceptor domain -containing protein [Puia sp.]|uniref:tetratricopeptide repeat-containing sensor histidine kinase n=1 Tax=Puia sp. TaxID=2045100 RepID=UPI002CA74B84|nr:histidine kinase dimerization/phosphoacceptor domain -containing protein [Puia sp.]HVU95254.1 histidine kinase dimerization/phosphoacceptor domain -containing protein [Puia sp.]